MKNVLVINSSLNGKNGHSNKLTQAYLERISAKDNISVTQVDLAAIELPHLSADEMQSWMTPVEERNTEQKELAAISDTFIEQLKSADIVVIGMPMYNFGVPSVFKAWIDRIARAGITFKYTEKGPQGLLEGKDVVVLAARGGMYAGTPKDSQSQYLNDVFAFIGLDNIDFIYAEGLAMGEASFNNAVSEANQKIIELIDKTAA